VNDKTAHWGGGGFAASLARRWPEVQRDFQLWGQEKSLKLGKVHFASVAANTFVASMVRMIIQNTNMRFENIVFPVNILPPNL
jgi:hypothetical protein